MKNLWLVVPLALVAGCFNPNPPDRSFKCDAAHGLLCPVGLHCDEEIGFCVHVNVALDMGYPEFGHGFDLGGKTTARSCDDRVSSGSFSGLTNLGAVNSSADETSFALTPDGKRLYLLVGGTLMTSAIDAGNPKLAGAPSAVTIAGGPVPTTLTGETVTADGKLWVAGTSGGKSNLYLGHFDAATALTFDEQHLPQGLCPLSNPSFVDGDVTKELYLAYPLAGCNAPEGRGSYVVQGGVDRNIGAFTAALSATGYGAPFVLPGGKTLLMSSVGAGARLYFAQRPALDALWSGPSNLPLRLGGTTRDVQATVSPDCNTFYFSSERAGGKGGLDLWAADIQP